uniref:Uncharacterized protein n=1 Tax=Lepisosteus oculatus TaxID=7918 RepID=W5LVV7_LEPOC
IALLLFNPLVVCLAHRCRFRCSGHSNVISSCCFTGNGRHLCTASWDKTLRLWDIPTGRFRSRGGVTLSKGHEGNISSCVFSEDSSLLVSGACDRNVTVWDMEGPCKKLVLKVTTCKTPYRN